MSTRVKTPAVIKDTLTGTKWANIHPSIIPTIGDKTYPSLSFSFISFSFIK